LPGRPTKLTPERHAAVVKAAAAGLPRELLAKAAGVQARTLRGWMAKGKAATKGVYRELFDAVRAAEIAAIETCLAVVMKAAAERDEVTTKVITYRDGTTRTETTTKRVFEWTAAAWLLERRAPSWFSSAKHVLDLNNLAKLVKEFAKEQRQEEQRPLPPWLTSIDPPALPASEGPPKEFLTPDPPADDPGPHVDPLFDAQE
jgi:hypothetical protein